MAGENSISEIIIAMEKSALERWGKGDPSGFLEISSEDVCYFDPYVEQRVNGIQELSKLYESIRGLVKVDSFEIINPKVQIAGNTAILTFNYVSYTGDSPSRWNCTEVYEFKNNAWKIIQTHWSYTQPFNN